MAQTTAEYIAALEEERDVLQAKLKAIADNGDSYSVPGALVNSSGSVGADHAEFYARWQKRLDAIYKELKELRNEEVYFAERRGVT